MLKNFNAALQSIVNDEDMVKLPSTWPDEFKELFRVTVNKSCIADKDRDYLHRRGEKVNIDAEEIDIYIDRTTEHYAEEEREDREMDDDDDREDLGMDDLDDELPPEFKKYAPVLECLMDEDYARGAMEAAKLFAPLLLICLAIIVVCFIIKWWLGLMAIIGVIVYLCMKGYALYNKFEKYI